MVFERQKYPMQKNKLYLILDMKRDWRFLLSQISLESYSFVQLRDKNASDEQMLLWGRELLQILSSKTSLIINDRVQLAKKLGVGVHLGMEDMRPDEARSILGDDVPIGLTIHNRIDLAQKYEKYIDYIGVGPVFPTITKTDAKSVLGVNILRDIHQESPVPVVAIGGIGSQNCKEVWEAGVEQIAVCSAIMKATQPEKATIALSNNIG